MKHIIFDVDGTLIDTEQPVLLSLRDMLKTVTGTEYPLEELTFALGVPSEAALKKLSVEPAEPAVAIWEQTEMQYLHTVKVFPGIRELLHRLREQGCHLGIVTSRHREEYEAVFVPLGIADCFDTVILADDTQKHKPDPEPLLEYARVTGAKREEMTYIGDSPYDFACAAGAGIRFFLAGWGARQPVPVEDAFRAETPEALLRLL